MWNPFKAIASGIGKAVSGVGKALGGGLSKAGGAMSKAGDKLAGKAPTKAPSAPTARPTPTKAPPVARTTTTIPVERPPAPTTGKILPPSMVPGGGTSGGMARDDAILGADSDAQKDLLEAVKEFEANSSLLGLSKEARDFLNQPSFAAIFDQYVTGDRGFGPEQWEKGMSNARNFQIARDGNQIKIIFDGDFDIDGGYDLGGRSPYATF